MRTRTKNLPSEDGFTLLELMVVMAIIVTLAAMMLPGLSRAKDQAKKTTCMSNLRQIAYGYHLYNLDYKDHLPTTDQLGNSSYRESDDPLSLCYFMNPYVPATSRAWLCPAGRDALVRWGASYAWSRAQNLIATNGSSVAFNNMMTTVVVWDNFTYTLPSVFNVPESPSTGGPTAVASYLRYYPHLAKKKANYLYLDGHVICQ